MAKSAQRIDFAGLYGARSASSGRIMSVSSLHIGSASGATLDFKEMDSAKNRSDGNAGGKRGQQRKALQKD